MNLITFRHKDPLLREKDKNLSLEENNFYIGDWCLKQDNIFQLDKNKYKTPKYYHWDAGEKLNKDYIHIKKVHSVILNNLSKSLNLYHNTQYPLRYWEILISRWIELYLVYLFDRWEILRSVFEKNKITSSLVFNFNQKNFIPKNTFSFAAMISNNYWNHMVFSEMIKFNKNTKIIYLDPKKEVFFKEEKLEYYNQINFYLSKNKIFFYKFDIPLNLKIKLLLSNFQFALKFKKKYLDEKIKNTKPRDSFYKYETSNDKFLNFANSFLTKNFPKIFLEEYQNLEETYKKILWPKNPNFIITSHAQYHDEIFKIYTAKKILNGSKYLIAQHGGNFGIEKNAFNISMEMKVCDRFLTWGWKRDQKTHPLFLTTIHGKKTNKILFKKKKLMLVVYHFSLLPSKSIGTETSLGHWTRTREKRNAYTLNIIKFLEGLKKNIINNLNINYKQKYLPEDSPETEKKSILHKFPKIKFILGSWRKEFWGYEKEYEMKFSNKNKFDKKKYSHDVRNEFCLQVETVFSTGFVEAMYLNRPVILLYNANEECVEKDFLYYLKILKKEKICFYDYNEGAKFINSVYDNDNLNLWWNSDNLQNVRKLFCEKYCRHSKNPIKDFKKSLIFNE